MQHKQAIIGGDAHWKSVLLKEHPYPNHCATKDPQLNIHCSRPDIIPRDAASAISPAYMGTVAVSMPTATPAMNRPMMSMVMLIAPPCSAQPTMEMQAPTKTDIFRPSRSPVKMLMMVPRMAPPWKADTTPPVTVSFGLLKYRMNSVWPIVEVMIPLSYPKRKPIRRHRSY